MSEHHHSHAAPGYGRAFAVGIVLNVSFVAVEAAYGWQSGSLALLADAGHNLSDVGGLALAWLAFAAARLLPDSRHTYGWRRGSILASFTNAVVLLIAMGSLAWEAIQRLSEPQPVAANVVMIVAALGVAVNAITAAMFFSGSHRDLNIRGAFLHMAADALVSLGVVFAGALSLWLGWRWIDPAISLVIVVVVTVGTWSLLKQSLHLLFDGVPEHVELPRVKARLQAIPGVYGVHDLHVWAMDTREVALSAHLVLLPSVQQNDQVLQMAISMLHDDFEIRHATLQLESPAYATTCKVATETCQADTPRA